MGKKLVDPNKLCMGCMSVIEHPERTCPICGFNINQYNPNKNGLPLGEILKGKYLIGKVLGVGGFGITYIAWDLFQAKKVCVKEYFPAGIASRNTMDALYSHTFQTQQSLLVVSQCTDKAKYVYNHGLQSFIKEAENLSKFFTLPGIVSVRDFFKENNTAYITMEFINGIDFRAYAKQVGGRIEPGIVFELLKNVLKALYEVHKENIIHRDISPDNIMLSDMGEAKLVDFGAAKKYDGSVDDMVFLKHGYAPIEQYSVDGNQGPWTDIYSLCATIYFLLTGKKIQKAQDRMQEDKTMLLQAMGVPVSENIDFAIRKGLMIEIANRYQSVADLYYDLYGERID